MQTRKNYKNARMRILVPDNPAKPLNAMSSGNTELSSSCSLEGCSTEKLDKVVINRVPVISKSGKPLMPCKSAKARRFRKTRQRPKRFDNRNREGFIAPSQRAKVEFRLTIIKELCKLGLKKISKKDKRCPESHATDAIALASMIQTVENITLYPFYVWIRYQNRRRQLHKLEPERIGKRRREGGTNSIYPFKKNDVSASPTDCHRLFNQKIMFEVEHGSRYVNPASTNARGQIPPASCASGLPLTP